ncbi:hypothetical protein HFN_1448 [Helicobacter fennelliae MRY12-0050]|uniref:Uncharacterized protein n=1 Tax=Helicobacter fennelliae MRY12-0050 TaxID=1325130 RepID=T1CMC5_9HELI|nr:hypothetical protein HFN_1448 [Helicobacter fennelliae MRY12-0050]
MLRLRFYTFFLILSIKIAQKSPEEYFLSHTSLGLKRQNPHIFCNFIKLS